MQTQSIQTTKTISCLENLVLESQQLLRELTTRAEQQVNLVVRISHPQGKEYQTTLYQEHPYVLVAPEGKKHDALLYGNWEEALHATQQKIKGVLALQKPISISIDHYAFAPVEG